MGYVAERDRHTAHCGVRGVQCRGEVCARIRPCTGKRIVHCGAQRFLKEDRKFQCLTRIDGREGDVRAQLVEVGKLIEPVGYVP